MIQFDSFDMGADKHTATATLDEMNAVLQERFPDITPQIFVGAIDDNDIEIADQEDEPEEDSIFARENDSEEDCIKKGLHYKSFDEDGFCNNCGYK